MAALAAANVTTVISERVVFCSGSKLARKVRGTIAFGDGALTYPTAGVPLPSRAALGFTRNIDSMTFFSVNERTTDYHLRYGPANHTLLMYEEEAVAAGGPLLECDTSEAPAARTYGFEAWGW